MKIAKGLMPLLLIVLAVTVLFGCSHTDKSDVRAVITNELDLLKNLDNYTTQKYVSYKELFPDATTEIKLSDEVKEVFSLFFQDFDYKILSVDVDNDNTTATAKLNITTLDAKSLATDYSKASLKSAILKAAASEEQTTEQDTDSMEERYVILDQLLKENDYDTVEQECTIELRNNGTSKDEWEITRTHSLENELVGGLITYLSDNDLLSAEDTLTVYLNTLKSMNTKQMGSYLGIDSLLNTSDTDKNSIATALVELVHNNFDFEITGSEINGYEATVTSDITTFDSDAILDTYQKELDTYLASADAVIDGSTKRYEKSLEMLLENIKSSTATVTSEATFHLKNDGVSWKLEDSGSTIGDAIFGNLSSSPVSSESDSSDATNESDDSYDSDASDTESTDDSEDSDGSENTSDFDSTDDTSEE